ncbi:MAG: STAS domain-containing protein [Rhodospirillaceae bacterium]
MVIIKEAQSNTYFLTPKPGVDSSSAAQFEEILLEGVEAANGSVVVDCADLDYISSAGLRAILIAAKASKSKGRKLILCSMKRHIRKIFDTSGFTQLLPIVLNRDDAIATQNGFLSSPVRAAI